MRNDSDNNYTQCSPEFKCANCRNEATRQNKLYQVWVDLMNCDMKANSSYKGWKQNCLKYTEHQSCTDINKYASI